MSRWINTDACYGEVAHIVKWQENGTATGKVEVCIVCGKVIANITPTERGCWERNEL